MVGLKWAVDRKEVSNKKGKKEGRWSEWYEDGTLANSFGYINDKPNGKCT